MPRTNTEIDRDLEKTKAALRELEKSLLSIENAIEADRTGNELRGVHLKELLERVETSQEKLRQEQDELRMSVTVLRTEFKELKQALEEARKQRWTLILGIVLAIAGVLFGLGKDFINGQLVSK